MLFLSELGEGFLETSQCIKLFEMPEPCNVGFLFVSSVAGQGIQNHTDNLKNNSFFLTIILSHVLHSCLGLIEIYEYENKQKSSF